MARITCAISGISFKCEHVPMALNHREFYHPIFALPQRKLLGLYTTYTKGHLTDIDSYLLFCALLQSTDSVNFAVPASMNKNTPTIIANNIAQLVRVIWESNAITHPAFKQPGFYIRADTASLSNIHIWIKAWISNIEDFKSGLDRRSEQEKLQAIENKLSKLIFTPEAGQTKLIATVADWADKAAVFPVSKRDAWKLIIRKCYNLNAMFSTPKSELVEIKNYCEENIESGSIHFHTLMKTLRTGIANHNDFLGLSSLESTTTDCGYTLIEETAEDRTKRESILLAIIAKAPDKEPVEKDYSSKLTFIRAKLAYKQAQNAGITGTST